MVYCMSDIHGNAEKFHAMLTRIQFCEKDTLYILGDIIDRGSSSVDLLREVMATPNMILLLGNHEQMMLNTLGDEPAERLDRERWLWNGGTPTYVELLNFCTPQEREDILTFVAGLPDHLDIEVSGQKYHLVHACPADNRNERIWGRPIYDGPAIFPDRTVIVGHMLTCRLVEDPSEPMMIWHGNCLYDIDCGCGTHHHRLACLRLDDLAEFYV